MLRHAVRVVFVALLVPAGSGASPAGERAAAAYLRAAAARAGRPDPMDQLRIERVLPLRDGQAVRYRQTAQGVPVLGGGVVVRLDAAASAVRVGDGRAEVGPFDPQPVLSLAEAIRAGAEQASGKFLLPLDAGARGAGRLVVIPGVRSRLAWEVWLPAALRTDNPRLLVDARSGELLAARNDVVRAGPDADRARVFPDSRRVAEGLVEDVYLSGFAAARDPEGHLSGERVTAYNCCPNAGCDGVSPPPEAQAFFSSGGPGTLYTVAACDERQRASNRRAEGDYVYAPAADPVPGGPPVPGPSEGDEFSEVNAYHHANLMLDHVRAADPSFELAEDARPLRITVNYLVVDTDSCARDRDGVRCPKLRRYDNAFFLAIARPGELIAYGIEERKFASVILGQGHWADFGYDADVVYHEVGHAIVDAVSALDYGAYALDAQGAWLAPATLHEGLADFFAAAASGDPSVGDYIGPRLQAPGKEAEDMPRDLAGATHRCPDSIVGEPHADSLPWSSALWSAREALATAPGVQVFDRALLDALKTLTPRAAFSEAAGAVLAEVERAAPGARAAAEAAFRARGILDCPRHRDLDEGETIDYVELAARGADPRLQKFAPGPYQFRLRAPAAATAARLRYLDPAWEATHHADVHMAYSKEGPVEFSYDAVGGAAIAHGQRLPYGGSVALGASCEAEELFVALLNEGPRDFETAVFDIQAKYTSSDERRAACGLPPLDAKAAGPAGGCGCGGDSSGEGLDAAALLLALLGAQGQLRGAGARRRL